MIREKSEIMTKPKIDRTRAFRHLEERLKLLSLIKLNFFLKLFLEDFNTSVGVLLEDVSAFRALYLYPGVVLW